MEQNCVEFFFFFSFSPHLFVCFFFFCGNKEKVLVFAFTNMRLNGKVKLFDFRSAFSERTVFKIIIVIFDQFNESDHKTPRMRATNNETLHQDTNDLVLDGVDVGESRVGENAKQSTTEIVSVFVWKSQLICDRIQHVVTPFVV